MKESHILKKKKKHRKIKQTKSQTHHKNKRNPNQTKKSPKQQKSGKIKREQAKTLCPCNQVYDWRVLGKSSANGNADLVEHIKKLKVLPMLD